jgi:succinate dehydrogenase / fumarate reductase cytochrome b subunit
MALLGSLIFVFLIIHMGDFWAKMKLGLLNTTTYPGFANGEPIKNLYERVAAAYSNPIYVVIYVLSMVVLYFHLAHGFQSAFQTMGINHRKYTPFIKGLGQAYAFLVALGFALIPIIFFLTK